MDRLNAACLIIAPAMGLSRKIGGFLMAGASFFGDRSLYYTINPGDAHGSFSVKNNSSLRTPNSYLNRLLNVQNLPFYNCCGCYYAVRK